MLIQDKFTNLVAARHALAAAQSALDTATHALFNQSDPTDEFIKPGQASVDPSEMVVYVNVAGSGQTFERVGYMGPAPAPPAA